MHDLERIFSSRVQTIFSYLSYYVWGTLVIVQLFDLRFLADLHVLVSGESKKTQNEQGVRVFVR